MIEMNWFTGYTHSPEGEPEKWVPSGVPGAVQLDWAKAHGWGDYFYADNFKDYEWMEDVFWIYSARLTLPENSDDQCVMFCSRGIDYHFIVKLDDVVIHEQEGMFTPFEIDITGIAENNSEIRVVVFPAPKRAGAPKGQKQADQCCKPAVSYGWDWHPRLIPLGIWDDTYVEVRPACHMVDTEARYTLSEDFSEAAMTLDIILNRPSAGSIVWKLLDRYDEVVFEKRVSLTGDRVTLNHTVPNPRLWWPNGQGEPVLYRSVIEFFDEQDIFVQRVSKRIGFRIARLVMHPGAWDFPPGYPKTRSNPPITMEINGRRIFCKGSNWVNPEIFPGIISHETYKPLLLLAKDANFNLLRSWGGGIINKEAFFDLCDEMGLMVWQEFPLACNNYAGTPDYLKVLDRESRSIIKRLRSRACLVLWCGGNELFNSWSGMTEQSAALRLLNRNCYDLSPEVPFIMTSPLMGMAHGNYLFRDNEGREVFQVMPQAGNTAYTEFGCPGPSSAEYLKGFIPVKQLFPPRPGTVWESHHAFNAWVGETWLTPVTIKHYFGKSETLEQLVERGQLLQCEGYKCIFEEARRQKPVCSMALNWCYNEPWPTAANNSIINWPAVPKPAYHAVKASCRPVLASARIPRFSWNAGDVFNVELWILNDLPERVPAGIIKVYLEFDEKSMFLLKWDYPTIDANTNLSGPTLRHILPDTCGTRMRLVLKSEGNPCMDSEYTLVLQRGN